MSDFMDKLNLLASLDEQLISQYRRRLDESERELDKYKRAYEILYVATTWYDTTSHAGMRVAEMAYQSRRRAEAILYEGVQDELS